MLMWQMASSEGHEQSLLWVMCFRDVWEVMRNSADGREDPAPEGTDSRMIISSYGDRQWQVNGPTADAMSLYMFALQ